MKNNCYGVVGNGRMANHFSHYLNLLGIDHVRWKREESLEILGDCNIVLLLISDDSIKSFKDENPILKEKTLIHFSGALSVPGVIGFHPLMTFGEKMYSLDEYKEIPFIGSGKTTRFYELFPELKNPYYRIEENQKAFYHALCVISGNFSSILWSKVFKDFQKDLALPEEVLKPYLKKVFTNIFNNPTDSLTGPIKRQDKKTIKKNIGSLNNLWGKIYKLFNKAYQAGRKHQKHVFGYSPMQPRR